MYDNRMVRRLSLRLNIAASATATEIKNNHIKQDKYYIMKWLFAWCQIARNS